MRADGQLVQWFERDGWLLIRNYANGVGASLIDAFGIEDQARRLPERYCHTNAITFAWQPNAITRARGSGRSVVKAPSADRRAVLVST